MDIQIHDKTFGPFIGREAIAERVQEIGKRIEADYKGQNPLLLVVLQGAFVFGADLARSIALPVSISFVRLSSYTGDTSTGSVITRLGLTESISGRPVIVVEDIVDTGTTLHYFLPMLRHENPASLKVASFLVKPDALQYPDVKVDYCCFEVPNKFVVGYGLDYDGMGRNLPDLYQQLEQ